MSDSSENGITCRSCRGTGKRFDMVCRYCEGSGKLHRYTMHQCFACAGRGRWLQNPPPRPGKEVSYDYANLLADGYIVGPDEHGSGEVDRQHSERWVRELREKATADGLSVIDSYVFDEYYAMPVVGLLPPDSGLAVPIARDHEAISRVREAVEAHWGDALDAARARSPLPPKVDEIWDDCGLCEGTGEVPYPAHLRWA